MSRASSLFLLPLLGALILAACGEPAADSSSDDDEVKRKKPVDAGIRDGAPGDGSPGPGSTGLGPNDVSVLWPVPEEGDLPAGYLKLIPQAGERGPYFPKERIEDPFPQLHADLPTGLPYGAAVVVAMRIDPCAATSTAARCVHELRLSAQPLSHALDDAALHLVYRLDDATFRSLVADVTAWKATSPVPTGSRLSAHPGLASAGLTSPFAKRLHDVVVKYATEKALARVTFNAFALDTWFFSTFDRSGAEWTKGAIPTLTTESSQSWALGTPTESVDALTGTLFPLPPQSFGAFLKAGALDKGVKSPEVLAARDAVLRFENPKQRNAANADCVSCHLAASAHQWAEKRGVSFATPDRYVPPPGLDVHADVPAPLQGNVSNLIAFGYHHHHHQLKFYPSISARVANETAEVLARLAAGTF